MVSAGLACCWSAIVEELPVAGVAAQKLPKPCVGQTAVGGGQLRGQPPGRAELGPGQLDLVLARRAGRVRPVEPISSEPPVNTAMTWSPSASA